MSDGRWLALCVYRPRDGMERQLEELLMQEIATLRARGHITERGVAVCRTERDEYLIIIEWRTSRSVDEAHADPDIVELWERKETLAEYLGPRDLVRSDVPFASYEVIADA